MNNQDVLKEFREKFLKDDDAFSSNGQFRPEVQGKLPSLFEQFILSKLEEKYNYINEHILDIVAEFGDNPKACLQIICEWFEPSESPER